ncbi:MAG: hypothetical protein OXI63_15965 [Candidatus Poribacteria bacterium]|nr:hypothetical protein [Candidatus Poribacteria bacterium]
MEHHIFLFYSAQPNLRELTEAQETNSLCYACKGLEEHFGNTQATGMHEKRRG